MNIIKQRTFLFCLIIATFLTQQTTVCARAKSASAKGDKKVVALANVSDENTKVLAENEGIIKTNKKVKLSNKNKQLAQKLIYGEAGTTEDFFGLCLVAQAIRDTVLYEDKKGNKDAYSIEHIIEKYKYSGDTTLTPDKDAFSDVKEAYTYIFEDGYSAVDSTIYFFYAPKYSKGKFHETQKFVIEHGGHRFFDRKDS